MTTSKPKAEKAIKITRVTPSVTLAPEWLVGHPELLAFLQAQNSRTLEPIAVRLDRLSHGAERDKSRAAMKKWFLDYRHRSIGQCGTATVFLEGIPLGDAPLFQDSPLYNGQECSTRFIDFEKQPHIALDRKAPSGDAAAAMKAYRTAYDCIVDLYCDKVCADSSNPPPAVKAFAFDVARSFLPLSITTNLSITLNLDEWDRVLNSLAVADFMFPTPMRKLVKQIRTALHEAYPCAIPDGHFKAGLDPDAGSSILVYEAPRAIQKSSGSLSIPNHYYAGSTTMDFGTYRDLHRHRPMHFRIVDRGSSKVPHVMGTLLNLPQYLRNCVDMVSDTMTLGSVIRVSYEGLYSYMAHMMEQRLRPTVHPLVRMALKNITNDHFANPWDGVRTVPEANFASWEPNEKRGRSEGILKE